LTYHARHGPFLKRNSGEYFIGVILSRMAIILAKEDHNLVTVSHIYLRGNLKIEMKSPE
jgi:hypothetical protein